MALKRGRGIPSRQQIGKADERITNRASVNPFCIRWQLRWQRG